MKIPGFGAEFSLNKATKSYSGGLPWSSAETVGADVVVPHDRCTTCSGGAYRACCDYWPWDKCTDWFTDGQSRGFCCKPTVEIYCETG